MCVILYVCPCVHWAGARRRLYFFGFGPVSIPTLAPAVGRGRVTDFYFGLGRCPSQHLYIIKDFKTKRLDVCSLVPTH